MSRLRSYISACFALVLVACDSERLNPAWTTDAGVDTHHAEDGGSPVDGGADDAGVVEDAGAIRDGGDADAGLADAGIPDAGDSGCAFPDNPDVAFVCEGDEDFCDAAYDVQLGAADIVATWSHVDGEHLIVDVRFRAMPFRGGSSQLESFALGYPYHNEAAGWVFSEPTEGRIYSVAAVDFGDEGPPLLYPPEDLLTLPVDLAVGDRCALFELSMTEPLLRLRYPVELLNMIDGGEPFYSVVSVRPNIPLVTPYQIDDVFFANGEELLRSLGGTPDDLGELVNVCDLSCASAQ